MTGRAHEKLGWPDLIPHNGNASSEMTAAGSAESSATKSTGLPISMP